MEMVKLGFDVRSFSNEIFSCCGVVALDGSAEKEGRFVFLLLSGKLWKNNNKKKSSSLSLNEMLQLCSTYHSPCASACLVSSYSSLPVGFSRVVAFRKKHFLKLHRENFLLPCCKNLPPFV